MYDSFPVQALEKVRCNCGGSLTPVGAADAVAEQIAHGLLVCSSCSRSFPIVDGILRLLDADTSPADGDSELELRTRDDLAEEYDAYLASIPLTNEAEVIPTLDALRLGPTSVVLELGCGTGRFTTLLEASPARLTVAVDFSIKSLAITARRIEHPERVALVHADITTLYAAAEAFDRVLSTCGSNLPTPWHREQMYRLASHSLASDGRFVFSLYYYNLRRRLTEPPIGRYPQTGVYYQHFRPGEVRAEISERFGRVVSRPIVALPHQGERLGSRLARPLRLLAKVPLANQNSALLLCTAFAPKRDRHAEQ